VRKLSAIGDNFLSFATKLMLCNNVSGQQVPVEEVNMNAIPNELGREGDTEVASETDDGLVEVGAVSETKGGVFGASNDLGAGYQFH
jgi:hypothetical protein